MISSAEFKIIDYYQSKKSYAFYLNFYPVSEDGERLDEVQIRFRIADHKEGDEITETHSDKAEKIIKSFYVGGKKYPDTISVMRAVRDICKHLKQGDYRIL